jgi:hypothetical protein
VPDVARIKTQLAQCPGDLRRKEFIKKQPNPWALPTGYGLPQAAFSNFSAAWT